MVCFGEVVRKLVGSGIGYFDGVERFADGNVGFDESRFEVRLWTNFGARFEAHFGVVEKLADRCGRNNAKYWINMVEFSIVLEWVEICSSDMVFENICSS